MKRQRIEVSAGAALAAALFFFFGDARLPAIVLPAVLVHELGHCCALIHFGSRLTGLQISLFGMELNYTGELNRKEMIICAMAGPLLGACYGIPACAFGGANLRISGAISFSLSIFNLLPILPLDGGRIAAAITDEVFAEKLSRAAALLLLAGGAILAAVYRAWMLLMMGIWLAFRNFRT